MANYAQISNYLIKDLTKLIAFLKYNCLKYKT